MDNLRKQFSAIYDEYIGKIYRFVYVKVNSQETAEDITSKSFLKAWEAYQEAKGSIVNMRAFLYQIARNLVIDHYRQADKAKFASAEEIGQIPDKANIHEQAVFSADLEAVKAAIGKLKPEYQDVLIFHYLDDMTIPEIAELLQKPEGTVRVTIHRGLNSLRGVLNQEV